MISIFAPIFWFSSVFFSSSLKKDNFGFSFTGSLSSSLKNDNFGFGLGCSLLILTLFKLFAFVSLPISSKRVNLGFGFSCSKLILTFVFILIFGFKLAFTFKLIFSLTLLFSIFGSSSFSLKNDIFGFSSVFLGSLSNKLNFDSLIWFWFDCVNKLTFLVISAVLSTIFDGSISSSSSLSNIFFNLFLAFSKSLLRFISIAFVSFWNKLN